MSRITINNLAAAVAAVAMLAGLGCSKKYAQKPLQKDGPEGQEVLALIAALRSAGPEGLEQMIHRQAAGNLTQRQAKALRATLSQLAKAQAVELEDLTRFGDKVYRAVLRVSSGGTSQTLCLLLVQTDQGLRWAGQN